MYHLSDMEEDEEDEENRRNGILEKGAAERSKEEEDEEEEGGITFNVRCSSTPEEKKDRKHAVSSVPFPPLSTGSPAASSSIRLDFCPTPLHATEKPGQSPQPIPGASEAGLQSQSQTLTSTAVSSSGKNHFL